MSEPETDAGKGAGDRRVLAAQAGEVGALTGRGTYFFNRYLGVEGEGSIGIDDATIDELGGWPLNRRVYADLLKKLADTGNHPKAIGFDINPARIAELQHGQDQVFFGATVTYCDEAGTETTVTIRGIDETDNSQGQVSWVSPVAQALLKAREGDEVRLMTPTGWRQIEVLAVSYPAPQAPD